MDCGNPISFISSCLPSLSFGGRSAGVKKEQQTTGPPYVTTRYNNQLRTNLGLPERPLQLPALVESENHANASRQESESRAALSTRSLPTSAAPTVSDTDSLGRMHVRSQRFPAKQKYEFTTSSMDTLELAQLFDALHSLLSHVPYAVCGLGAMINHGFTGRNANKISILCPAHSKDNVKHWLGLTTQNVCRVVADSVGIFVPQPGSADGSPNFRRVRIKYLDNASFERLERVKSSIGNAYVLSMASQLDNVAAGWLDNRKRGDERALKVIEVDVFWCLDRIARTKTRIDRKYLPTLLGEAFWTPFTEQHPKARPEMARAGIDVGAVLRDINAAAALREHEDLLRSCGYQGASGAGNEEGDTPHGVVSRQPGLFEGMRDLANSKSVYTLRSRDSRLESDMMMAFPPLSEVLPPQAPEKGREPVSADVTDSQRTPLSRAETKTEKKDKKKGKNTAADKATKMRYV